jgi:hypothetical protein
LEILVTPTSQCPVCLEELDLKKEISSIYECRNCKQPIHKNCYTGWLGCQETCPLCRGIDIEAIRLLHPVSEEEAIRLISRPVSGEEATRLISRPVSDEEVTRFRSLPVSWPQEEEIQNLAPPHGVVCGYIAGLFFLIFFVFIFFRN